MFTKTESNLARYIDFNVILPRINVDTWTAYYNEILKNPEENIKKIHTYLELPEESLEKMINVVDKKLYRNRKTN